MSGILFTTFSIIGRCARTGRFGVAVATSEVAVGSRCIHVAPGVGAILTQAYTDPRLGFLGLNLLRQGHPAARILDELIAGDPHVARRQLGCLDPRGRSAGHTGAENTPWAGHRAASDVVAAANAVTGPAVVEAMFETFQAGAEFPLWERLLRALEAGKSAGGQPDGEQSGGLYVVDREPYATVDLRVDQHPDPVAELRRLAGNYFPMIPYYSLRPTDPNVPRSGAWLAEEHAAGRSPIAVQRLPLVIIEFTDTAGRIDWTAPATQRDSLDAYLGDHGWSLIPEAALNWGQGYVDAPAVRRGTHVGVPLAAIPAVDVQRVRVWQE